MANDTILYNSVNRRQFISAPSSIRMRSRFRGIRESYKINLEMSQFLFDIRRLYEKYNIMDADLESNINSLEQGLTINITSPLTTLGTLGLSEKLSSLDKRLKNLES